MWFRWLVGLSLAAACGAQPHASSSPGLSGPLRPEGDRLGSIRIEGNQAIASGALEPGLALYRASQDGTASGGTIDPYLLAVDADRIRAAYLKRGFFAVKVATRVERSPASGGEDSAQRVVFAVTEGPRSATRVEIAGLPPELSMATARAEVKLSEGESFDYDTYEAAKQPLTLLLQNAGYAHAEVRGAVIPDPAGATATARYEVTPGVLCSFGAIRVRGAIDESLAAAVRARLRFHTGDRYRVSVLHETQAELYAFGRFSAVQLVPDPRSDSGDSVIDVVIELSQASCCELHAGGGLGYEPASVEAHGRGGFGWVPAQLPLLTVAADARVAVTAPPDLDRDQLLFKFRGLAAISYLELWRPRLRGELEVGLDYQTVEAYTWTGEHVRLGLATPLTSFGLPWLQLRVGWILEQLQLTNPDSALDEPTRQRLRLDRDQRRGAYQASVVADLRDDPIEPHRGIYADVRVARGTRYALGELTYLQVTPEVRGYLALGSVVVAVRARLGAIFGDVPVTERFYSGGTAGQRGFYYRRLSPIATAAGAGHSVVIGGAGLIETGIELRRRLGELWQKPVGANIFLDGGDVTDEVGALDPANLYWAIGAGAWSKLYGELKLRVDVGYRLNDRGPDDPLHTDSWYDNLAFHIGIGEAY